MLAIRMQRTGRKGSAQFRVVVQDSRKTPTSGNIVALVGSYDPHAKVTTLNKEKISFYLKNGAQPSDRVIRILQQEKVELPGWIKMPTKKTAKIKNMDKLRKNRPVEEVAPEPEKETAPEEIAEVKESEEVQAEASTDEPVKEETPAAETEAPVEEAIAEPEISAEKEEVLEEKTEEE